MTSQARNKRTGQLIVASIASLFAGLVVGNQMMVQFLAASDSSSFFRLIAACALLPVWMLYSAETFLCLILYLIPFVGLVVFFSKGWLNERRPIMLALHCLTLFTHSWICVKFLEMILASV